MFPVRVVNVKGLRTPEQRAGVVYCGRPLAGWPGHKLSNPYRLEAWPDRASCLAAYRSYLLGRPYLERELADLWAECRQGALPLACWCSDWDGVTEPAPMCHAVELAKLLAARFGGSA